MTKIHQIREVCRHLGVQLQSSTDINSPLSESTWRGNISNGKAVEYLTLCILNAYFDRREMRPLVPRQIVENPEWMYLRNQIPLSHGARPGHAGAENLIDVESRFQAAFLPRLEFESVGKTFQVFREGVPLLDIIDYLDCGEVNQSRVDLAIIEGRTELKLSSGKLLLTWSATDFSLDCVIRAVNSPEPVIVECEIQGEPPILKLLVECSVAKPVERLRTQVDSYINRYGIELPTSTVFSYLHPSPGAAVGQGLDLNSIIEAADPSECRELSVFFSWLDSRFT